MRSIIGTVILTGSLLVLSVGYINATEACDDPTVKRARNTWGEWDLDSARAIADKTASLDADKRKAAVETATTCLDDEILTAVAERKKQKGAEDAAKRSGKPDAEATTARRAAEKKIYLLNSLKASLGLIETEADLYDLHVETYAATEFSNLFREKPSDGFFSKSKPFIDFEISQVATGDRALEIFGDVGFKGTAAVTESNAVETVQNSNEFFADAGVNFFPNLLAVGPVRRGNIGVGLTAAVGFLGVPTTNTTDTTDTTDTTINDSFSPSYKAGIVVRQLEGHLVGSFAEYSYLRDPRFTHKDRMLARVRLRVGRENSDNQGHGLSSFLEGSVNIGKGKDEAKIIVGVGLDTEKIIKAILGLGSSQKEAANGSKPAN